LLHQSGPPLPAAAHAARTRDEGLPLLLLLLLLLLEQMWCL
jgi:hypothetical protein